MIDTDMCFYFDDCHTKSSIIQKEKRFFLLCMPFIFYKECEREEEKKCQTAKLKNKIIHIKFYFAIAIATSDSHFVLHAGAI